MKLFRLPPTAAIRRRLSLYIGSGLLALWLATATLGSIAALHKINETADSQMAQLAQTLMQVAPSKRSSNSSDLLDDLPEANEGQADDDNHGFAVWNARGRLLIADEAGQDIPYQTRSGFHNSHLFWQEGAWRYLYLHDETSGRTVAVSQSLHARLIILAGSVGMQLALSLLALPVLLLLLHFGIKRGLAPLNNLSQELSRRNADSLQAVSENVPSETLGMVQSLNGLLARVSDSMARERRFTADAAHELRSPLAALKVQADVLAMSRNEDEQYHHLQAIHESISRAQRLTDQLLVLARIDPLAEVPDAQAADWAQISEQALQSVSLHAREKRVRLQANCPCGYTKALPLQGNTVLLELMLRNLLDNAVRYSPEHSRVTLTLTENHISVCDEGSGISPEHLPRILERFYRPAGQTQQGSGLGLSIVERIARLHSLKLHIANRTEGGLEVRLSRV